MFKTFELIVEGQVQRVGFRNFVNQIVFESNFNGFIENLSNGNIRIVIQCMKKDVKKFVEKINIQKWPIRVSHIQVKEVSTTQEFKKFEIKRGRFEEEISERMDEAAIYFQKFFEKMDGQEKIATEYKDITKNFRNDSNKNFDKMDVKYGKISEQLEKANKKLDGMKDSMQRIEKKL